MNCPECDTLMFKAVCVCGFKVPSTCTIEIKKMGAEKSNYPLEHDDRTAAFLISTNGTGKKYAQYCLTQMRKVLRGQIC